MMSDLRTGASLEAEGYELKALRYERRGEGGQDHTCSNVSILLLNILCHNLYISLSETKKAKLIAFIL